MFTRRLRRFSRNTYQKGTKNNEFVAFAYRFSYQKPSILCDCKHQLGKLNDTNNGNDVEYEDNADGDTVMMDWGIRRKYLLNRIIALSSEGFLSLPRIEDTQTFCMLFLVGDSCALSFCLMFFTNGYRCVFMVGDETSRFLVASALFTSHVDRSISIGNAEVI